jgi:hypothetical protein
MNGVGGVEEDIGEMVANGIFAIKLPVDHVGDPGERVPVGGVEGVEGPTDALRVYTLMDRGVIDDIDVVVVDEEIVRAHSAIGKDGDRGKDEADCGDLPGSVGGGRGGKGVCGRNLRRAFAFEFVAAGFLCHGCSLRSY